MNCSSRRWIGTLAGLAGLFAVPAWAGQAGVGAADSDTFYYGNDGSLYSWGLNSTGQLGDGTTTNRSLPVKVPLPSSVTAFSTFGGGSSHVLAVGSNDVLYAWGSNNHGQLGDNTTTSHSTPNPVTLPAGVVVTAVTGGQAHSLALASDGRLFAWGDNTYGQLGDGTTTSRLTPVLVPFPTGVTAFNQVRAGLNHTVTIGNDGRAYAWGRNGSGQLCDGTTTDRPNAVIIPGGALFREVGAGSAHSLGRLADGHIYACGSNTVGQLGDGTTVDRHAPVKVLFPPAMHAFETFRTRGDHSIAEGDNGILYAWGLNDHGQLGDGTNTNRKLPTAVHLPSGITSLSSARVGIQHTIAWGSDSRVYAWGANSVGQLGDGSTVERTTPVRVTALPTYVQTATALYDTVSSGTLWTSGMRVRSWMRLTSEPTPNWPISTDIGPHGLNLVADYWAHDGANSFTPSNSYLTDLNARNAAVSTDANGNLDGLVVQLVSPNAPISTNDVSTGFYIDSRYVLPQPQVHAFKGPCTTVVANNCTDIANPTDDASADLIVSSSEGFLLFIGAQPNSRPTLKSPAMSVSEGAGTARVIVRRVGSQWGSLSVDYTTSDGSALAGSDYTTTSGTLTWADGDKTDKTIIIPILNDAVAEATQGFWIALSAPVNTLVPAYLGTTSKARITIIDNDPAVAFSDVSPGSFALSHINSLLGAGITTGCGSGKYCPADTVTRQTMAAFLVRAVEGEPATTYCDSGSPFSDVLVSNGMCKYIKRLSELAVTTGCGGGLYCPNDSVTRQQMAAFLVRAIEGEPASTYCANGSPFADVPISNSMCKYMKRLSELGVTTGCGGGNFCPNSLVNREQMAAFLGRAFLGM
jgi:alpha-tubulin suppressor-like RCC1 family protein